MCGSLQDESLAGQGSEDDSGHGLVSAWLSARLRIAFGRAIILDYAIKGISVEDLTAKEGLLSES